MRILIDMNLSPDWAGFLVDEFGSEGLEAIHWSAVGNITAPDAEIVEYAANRGYVVFTHDLDFSALLARRSLRSPSVIQVRTQEVLPESIGEVVIQAIRAARPYLDKGAVVTVEPDRHRIRILPL